MPNVISIEQTLFWVFWVNGLFILTLILPAKASYIFEYMSKAKLATETIMEKFSGKKSSSSDDTGLSSRIEKRRVATKESTTGQSGEPSAAATRTAATTHAATTNTDELGGGLVGGGLVGGGKVMKGGKDGVKACLSPMLEWYIKEQHEQHGKSKNDIINLLDQNKDNNISDQELLDAIPKYKTCGEKEPQTTETAPPPPETSSATGTDTGGTAPAGPGVEI